jgi:hypothetical protein
LPQERVARVRFFDDGTLLPQVEEISLYDLNSHPVLQYGLGDHVLIRSKLLPPTGIVEEVVNLAAGFVEGLVRTVTDYDDDPSTHQRATSGFTTDVVDWMGEVYKINTDGTVKVRLAREYEPSPEWTGDRFVLVKAEDLIVFEGDDDEEEGESVTEAQEWIDEGDAEDLWGASDISDDEWEDATQGDMDVDIPEASLDGIDYVTENFTPTETAKVDPLNTSDQVDIPSLDVQSPVDMAPVAVEIPDSGIDKEKCPGFAILETIPSDHPFKSDYESVQHGRDWLARLRKEHKILLTSLPGMYLF